MPTIRVNEICCTILGESSAVGKPCAIVRLTGCHRRCTYCDSAYAFNDGESMSLAEVLARVDELAVGTVLVTGGEPLLQPTCLELLAVLLADGREVLLETSGTLGTTPLAQVPAGVRRIVDVKTPGSGVPADQVDWPGLRALGPRDELKFVCCDRADYDWARDLVHAGERLPADVPIAFSPAEGRLDPTELAEWIVADRLDVRFQIQLHKVLWPGRERGV
ncbi:radical SAM protein [bacterium]|nr:radical SAM protein [bacterium]